MDRRQFIRTGSVVAAGAVLAARSAVATGIGGSNILPASVKPASRYRVRFRYGFLPGLCGAWIRVAELGNATQPIPFRLIVSTTADMKNVVSSDMYYANPRHSFATRTKFSTRGYRHLFVQVRLADDPKIASQVWPIRRHRKKAPVNA